MPTILRSGLGGGKGWRAASLLAAGKTVTVRIPIAQRIDTGAVRQFAQFLAAVQAQIAGKVNHD